MAARSVQKFAARARSRRLHRTRTAGLVYDFVLRDGHVARCAELKILAQLSSVSWRTRRDRRAAAHVYRHVINV